MFIEWFVDIIKKFPTYDTPKGGIRIVGFDGRSGCGKTTLANNLAKELGVEVFHLDDLYPGWDGLSVGVELYIEKILEPLCAGKDAVWQVWDWENSCWGRQKVLRWAPIVLVEGVGVGAVGARQYLANFFWLDAVGEVRKFKALQRDEYFVSFWEKWAEQEDLFFEKNNNFFVAFLRLDSTKFLQNSDEKVLGCVEKKFQVNSMKMVGNFSAPQIFEALYANSENVVWLDSSATESLRGNFSIIANDVGSYSKTVSFSEGVVVERSVAGVERVVEPFFRWLEKNWVACVDVGQVFLPAEVPVGVGFLGYLSYELKNETGGSGVYFADYAQAQFIFADRAIVFDHKQNCLYLVVLVEQLEVEVFDQKSCANVSWLLDTFQVLENMVLQKTGLGVVTDFGGLGVVFEQRESKLEYLQKIVQAKAEIVAGNSYEICLTTQFTANLVEEVVPWVVYLQLRLDNPAPFGSYLGFGGLHILSFSVERFVSLTAAGVVCAEPIKGTRPRGKTVYEDGLLAYELQNCAKDVAENVMIVDLLRNDLLHVVDPGSLQVIKLCGLESYASVHQLVSSIGGKLCVGVKAADLLCALFPGGSMSGAPKISSMKILDGLEKAARGVYAGGVGYFSVTGAMDLAMPIRTLVVEGLGFAGKYRQRWSLGVGGAITCESVPEEEYAEIIVKAAKIFSSLGVGYVN